jgi:hypothetical protein
MTMIRKNVPNLRRTRDGFGEGLRGGIFGAVNLYPALGQAIGARPTIGGDEIARARVMHCGASALALPH